MELRDFLTKYFRGRYFIRKDLAYSIFHRYKSSHQGMTFGDMKLVIQVRRGGEKGGIAG